MRKLAIMIAITATAFVFPGWVQQAQETTRALKALPVSKVPEPLTNPTADPCLECDVIYAGDSSTGLWRIDQGAGTSTFIGNMPFNMFDMAISSDGRLFGIRSNGDLYEISACDASGVLRTTVPGFNNGLTGDIFSTDLFAQGPPLLRIQTSGTFPITTIGGSTGTGPPDWCGASSGDLAVNPADGLLYSALECSACSGEDMLVTIDPATGNVLSEVGCIQDAVGNTFGSVFGLAFDSDCNLWGGNGTVDPSLIRIDPATAIATVVSISGGYNSAFGLASCPLDVVCGLALDIKPGSCPNSFNRSSNGVLPVALTGSDSFDVSEVDITAIELTRADGVGGSVSPHEGPPGPHTVIDDVATPFPGELCDCHEETSDGFDDLSMKFKSQDVVSALDLDGEDPGALIELCVSGNLNDGTPFGPACDCIRLVPPESAPGLLAVTSNLPGAWIDLTPPDEGLDEGGFTSFVRTYPLSTEVTLVAPTTHLGWVFVAWNVVTPTGPRVNTVIRSRSLTLPIEHALEVVEAVYQPGTMPPPGLGLYPSNGLPTSHPGDDGMDGTTAPDLPTLDDPTDDPARPTQDDAPSSPGA